jgi:hypothetical protein
VRIARRIRLSLTFHQAVAALDFGNGARPLRRS